VAIRCIADLFGQTLSLWVTVKRCDHYRMLEEGSRKELFESTPIFEYVVCLGQSRLLNFRIKSFNNLNLLLLQEWMIQDF
jgi:hypothetical protein